MCASWDAVQLEKIKRKTLNFLNLIILLPFHVEVGLLGPSGDRCRRRRRLAASRVALVLARPPESRIAIRCR